MTRNSHCSFCGAKFDPAQPWPRTCQACGNISYLNPLPVAVTLLPVSMESGRMGLLAVRRAIQPGFGKLALPGGFIELGETWQEAAVRELWEETGIQADAARVKTFMVRSVRDGHLLVFGRLPAMLEADLPPFVPLPEVSDRVVLSQPVELAFPLHTEAAARFFSESGDS